MKRSKTLITVCDMLAAKKNKKVMQSILERIAPFITYLSDKIFSFYGARWDSSLSFDDIVSFVTVSMIDVIKKYNPKKYDPKKDITGKKRYLDGFSYLSTMGSRMVKYYYEYHHMKKRIPLEKLVSLDEIITTGNRSDDNENDLLSILYDQELPLKNNFNIRRIINMFYGKYIDRYNNKNKIHLYDIIKLLLEENMTYTQISKKYGMSRQRVGKIIKDNIVKELKKDIKNV